MFHFRCPLCGASPKQVLLRDYLEQWGQEKPERFYLMFSGFAGAITEVQKGHSRWLTKKFSKAVDRLQKEWSQLSFDPPLSLDSFLRTTESGLHFEMQCPVCETAAGSRQRGNYFVDWPSACKVQTGNLLYETGLILWGVLIGLPAWAPGSFLRQLNVVRNEMRDAGREMSFLECPQCGRFTSCLYGGLEARKTGFCRWCLDMGGGMGIGFSFSIDENGKPAIEMMKVDHTAPAKNAWDILPPEVGQNRISSAK